MQMVWVEISVWRDSVGQPLLSVQKQLLSAQYGNLFIKLFWRQAYFGDFR
jgi:hypothetical protein